MIAPFTQSAPCLSLLLLSLSASPAAAYDMFNITQDYYTIALSGKIISNVVLGTGLNLDDPTNPVVATFGPFKGDQAATASVTSRALNEGEINSGVATFVENTSAYEYSKVIQANMNGAFNFGSGAVAYDYMKKVTEDTDVIIALIDHEVTSTPIDGTQVSWVNKQPQPQSENIDDAEQSVKHFLLDYGSHYVQSISYGYKIAIYGSIHSKSVKEVKQFKSAFKAVFSGGVGGYKLSATESRILTTREVVLKAEVTSGRITPETATILTRFDDINTFFTKLKQNKISIYPGPIRIQAISYWHTLDNYPKTQKLFYKADTRLEAPFGVPKGSIISWSPPYDAQIKNADGTITIVTPEGWRVCNGDGGAPDLTGRFVMGAVSNIDIGTSGGSRTHTHKIDIKYITHNTFLENASRKPLWRDRVAVPVAMETDVVPPYVELVYLMRM